jgi:hypothetical protein
VFAGMWASGALDLSMPIERDSTLALVIGGDTRSMTIEMSLPPTVAMDASGDLRLTAGDVIMTARDEQGDAIMSVAMTLSTTLGAEVNAEDRVELRLGEPQVWANILVQKDQGQVPLQDADLESLVDTVFPMVSKLANDAMETIPLPSLMGVSLDAPTLDSRAGYVVLQTGVSY